MTDASRHYPNEIERQDLRALAVDCLRGHSHLDADDLVSDTVVKLASYEPAQRLPALSDGWNQAYARTTLRNLAHDSRRWDRCHPREGLPEVWERCRAPVLEATEDPVEQCLKAEGESDFVERERTATAMLGWAVEQTSISARGWESLAATTAKQAPLDPATRKAASRASKTLELACWLWLIMLCPEVPARDIRLTPTMVAWVLHRAGLLDGAVPPSHAPGDD